MDQELLREIESDRQKEALKSFIQTYKVWLITLAVLVVGGLGGYFGWQTAQQQKTLAASVALRDATEALASGRQDDAREILQSLSEKNTPFQAIALFRQAALHQQKNEITQAVAVFQQIRDTSTIPDVFREYAMIRQGLALAEAELPKALRESLEKLAYSTSVWQFSAREILAMDALHKQDTQTALGYLMSVRDDQQAPSSLRERAGKIIETLPK